ncbi:uncharacterized protein JCM6883_005520 [Sporobolomyces salmoneus]|uniref:uncharacterized protein n=1 Tax=Sporobolomyces salmoneus TaxID=183962 RepID=UPI00317F3514
MQQPDYYVPQPPLHFYSTSTPSTSSSSQFISLPTPLERDEEARRKRSKGRRTTTTTVAVIQPRAQEHLATSEIVAAEAANFFAVYLDPSRTGFEANTIPSLIHNARDLQDRFYAAGKRLEALEQHDQLRVRLISGAAIRRMDPEFPGYRSVQTLQITQSAQEHADRTSVWRRPTLSNLTNLLLICSLVAQGDLSNPEAEHYLSAACAHFRYLFNSDSIEFSQPASSRRGWGAYTLAVMDTATALERRTPPRLSTQDFALFNPQSIHLPPPNLLPQFLQTSSYPQMLDQYRQPITLYLRIGRTMASLFAQPEGRISIQQECDTIRKAFEGLDHFRNWWSDSVSFLRSMLLDSIVRTTVHSAITINYMLGLLLEFEIATYLERRYASLQHSDDFHPSSAAAPLATTFAASQYRCALALCIFLRLTRNRNGIYLLIASIGWICSADRLNLLADTLCNASLDDYDLFPVGALDKLASVTFLIKSLEIVKNAYPSADFDRSLTRLNGVQVQLEAECGYASEMALILVVSISPSGFVSDPSIEYQVPDTPSHEFLKASELFTSGD